MSNPSTTCFVALVVHGGLLQLAVQLRLLSRSWPVLELKRRVVFSHERINQPRSMPTHCATPDVPVTGFTSVGLKLE
jgi:hypothetical protein